MSQLHSAAPYLDQFSAGNFGDHRKQHRHKRLLVQPVAVPDLSHTGVVTAIEGQGNPDVSRYTNVNGSVTNKLRNVIAKTIPAIRNDYLSDVARRRQDALNKRHDLRQQRSVEERRVMTQESISSMASSQFSETGYEASGDD